MTIDATKNCAFFISAGGPIHGSARSFAGVLRLISQSINLPNNFVMSIVTPYHDSEVQSNVWRLRGNIIRTALTLLVWSYDL